MKCEYCGSNIEQGQKFCGGCGHQVFNSVNGGEINPTIDNVRISNQSSKQISNNHNKQKSSNRLGAILAVLFAAIVLGTCLYFGYQRPFTDETKSDSNNNYDELIANPVVGTWHCGGSAASTDYVVNFILNKDMTFEWSKYNDEEDNHVYGNYEFLDLEKKNLSGEYSYYKVTLDGIEFVDEGVLQTEKYASQYEIGVSINKESSVIMNTKTSNLYFCSSTDYNNL